MDLEAIDYQTRRPPPALAPFVESCWLLANRSAHDLPVVILPDGRIDLFFTRIGDSPFESVLLGLDDEPAKAVLEAGRTTFAVSFRLPAVECLFKDHIAQLRHHGTRLPLNTLGIREADLTDFDTFCARMSKELGDRLPETMDERKRCLFKSIYASNGSIRVQELAEHAFWSARQINRYFNQTFGLSLKSYLDILRFRASFPQLARGRLFPEADFTDQPHFIRNIKKFAGARPKDLARNQDGRFIQLALDGAKKQCGETGNSH